jgi:putative endonuclease
MLASKRHGTLYVGVTSDLISRTWEHRTDLLPGFTQRYQVHDLVWYELLDSMASAIRREKQLKNWRRAWKIDLIEQQNPGWEDLYPTLI